MKQAGFRYGNIYHVYCACDWVLLNKCMHVTDKCYVNENKNCLIFISIYLAFITAFVMEEMPTRQFIKIHFSTCSPTDLHFIGYNMWTEDPMVFEMDCKVILQCVDNLTAQQH